MRIAHFLKGRCNPDSANGVEKTVSALSRTQAQLGHAVAIFSLTHKPVLPIGGVEVRTYVPGWHPFAGVERVLGEMRGWRPDVVHLHSGYVPANSALAQQLRQMGIPYVVTPNGVLASALLRRRPHLKVPYKYLFELPLLNRAAFVHAVGDEAEIRRYGVRAPIVLAPNGIDIASIPPDLVRDAVVRRWAHAAGRRIALFLGRLDVEQKGLDLLLRAFARATRQSPLGLVLVGPDWNGGRRRLEQLAATLGVDRDVCFWGPAFGKDKFDLLASADMFVAPSRWEGFPFSVIEALAIGTPCIVTRASDPLALVARSGAGRIVNADEHDIAAALRDLAEVRADRLSALGRAGCTLVEQELDWKVIAQTIGDGYARYCAAA